MCMGHLYWNFLSRSCTRKVFGTGWKGLVDDFSDHTGGWIWRTRQRQRVWRSRLGDDVVFFGLYTVPCSSCSVGNEAYPQNKTTILQGYEMRRKVRREVRREEEMESVLLGDGMMTCPCISGSPVVHLLRRRGRPSRG